ncbi:hypothetical protein [Leptolyngbya sp. Heron Island J]|uniref:hypothetical protein n=1 Tax=Leptolyngbya sp. Heron Island J TaxID=1385935 RepID=UPI00042185B7|nr:hypothetical protein [Leptolyngbya sp. Heron Island J]
MFLLSALLNGESLDASMNNAQIAYSSHRKSLTRSFPEERNQASETTSSEDLPFCDRTQAIDANSRGCEG